MNIQPCVTIPNYFTKCIWSEAITKCLRLDNLQAPGISHSYGVREAQDQDAVCCLWGLASSQLPYSCCVLTCRGRRAQTLRTSLWPQHCYCLNSKVPTSEFGEKGTGFQLITMAAPSTFPRLGTCVLFVSHPCQYLVLSDFPAFVNYMNTTSPHLRIFICVSLTTNKIDQVFQGLLIACSFHLWFYDFPQYRCIDQF